MATTCNCLNEIDNKLREQNLKIVGYAFRMPEFEAIAVIKTEWKDESKAPKGQKRRPPSMFASHCPFCGVKYPPAKSEIEDQEA